MKMGDFMKPVDEILIRLKKSLENDIDEFNSKLKLTRQNISQYIDRQIEYLINIKNEFNNEFNYLEEENEKTCKDNQQQFDKLCVSINQNNHHSTIVLKLLERFKQTFPLRPTMLKSIPEYNFKNIQIDDFIIKQNSSDNSSNNGFIPINDRPRSSLLTTSSIDSSYDKRLTSKYNEDEIEVQSRLASSCTTTSEYDNVVEILFKIDDQYNRNPHLMCYNEDENCILMYSNFYKFKLLNLNSRELSPINYSLDDYILNIGYSSRYHLYYYSTRKNNRFILFRLNEEKNEIEIEDEIELIKSEDHFINVHVYENFIYFLYLTTSSWIMFGKYNLDNSSIISSIHFENVFYENGEKFHYKIMDFTINNTFICLLTQFKNNTKSKIIIRDYQTMNIIHSFDLLDAVRPVSIISTAKKSKTMSNDDDDDDDHMELLFYINDPHGRLIHCCSYEKYLITTHISNFGICSLDDGNIVLITENDIRLFSLQNSIKKN